MTRRRALCVAKDYVAADAIKKVRLRATARIRIRGRVRIRATARVRVAHPNASRSAYPNIKKELKALNVTVVDTDDPPTWYVGKRKSKAVPKPAGLCFAFQKVSVLDWAYAGLGKASISLDRVLRRAS